MANSLRWFQYTSDSGLTYSFLSDESNIEKVHPAVPNLPAAPAAVPQNLPRFFRPRHLRLLGESGSRTRVITVATRARFDAITEGDTFELDVGDGNELEFEVILKVPERRLRVARRQDTAQDDGDNP